MSTKPTVKPDWALLDLVNGISGQNNVVEPTSDYKNYGYVYNVPPPRNYANWLGRVQSNWVDYFDATCQRSATKVVAAYNASADFKNMADYVCDGTADQVQINLALAAASNSGNSGGLVILSDGYFSCNGAVVGQNKCSLVGMGSGATVIAISSSVASTFSLITISGTCYNVYLADFAVYGNAGSIGNYGHYGVDFAPQSDPTDCVVERVLASSFKHYVSAGGYGFYSDRNGVTFRDCVSIQNQLSGFTLDISSKNCILDRPKTCQNMSNGIVMCGSYNAVITPSCVGDLGRGISLQSSLRNSVRGGTVLQCGEAGVKLDGAISCVDSSCEDVTVIDAGQKTDATYSCIEAAFTVDCVVRNNRCRDSDGTKQPQYGFLGTSNTACLLMGNDFRSSGRSGNCNADVGCVRLPAAATVADSNMV